MYLLPSTGTLPGPVTFYASAPFSPSASPTLWSNSWGYSSLWQSCAQIYLPSCYSYWWNCIYSLHWTILLFSKPLLWRRHYPCRRVPLMWGLSGLHYLHSCLWSPTCWLGHWGWWWWKQSSCWTSPIMFEAVVTSIGGKGWGSSCRVMANNLAVVLRLSWLSCSLSLKQSGRDLVLWNRYYS